MNQVLHILQSIATLPTDDQEGLLQVLLAGQRDRTRLRLLEQESAHANESIGQEVEEVLAMTMGSEPTAMVPVSKLHKLTSRGPRADGMNGEELMRLALNDLYAQKHEAINVIEWFDHIKVVAATKNHGGLARGTFDAYRYLRRNSNKWIHQGGGMYIPITQAN